MSFFIVACVALVLFSGFFLWLPAKRVEQVKPAQDASNRDWFALREGELRVDDDPDLRRELELRLLDDELQSTAAKNRQGDDKPLPLWLLLPLVAIAATVMYYRLGAAPDVAISAQLQALNEDSTPQQMQDLMQAIESRSLQRPDNTHYTALLGRFYMGQQDYRRASEVYGGLVEQAPGDSQVLAYAAQAEYLAGGRVLTDRAQMLAEQALAVDPHQRTALGLLGMVSFERGQYRAAIEYWQRLVAIEGPGSEGAQMIEGVIARAQQKLAESGAEPLVSPAQASPADLAMGVSVYVSLPEGAQLNPADTVFVLARSADSSSRMPVAVKRLRASELPLSLRLDDSNSMAGQKLSVIPSIVVVVQVSPDGKPGEANATWLGRAGPLSPSLDPEPQQIVLVPAAG